MEVDSQIDTNIKSNGGRQQKMLHMRKEKSRDAARNRRSKENLQYVELAKLLPLPESITSQLDKASVIRLTISFLKYREMTGRELTHRRTRMLQPVQIGQKLLNPRVFEKDLGLHLLQAMDGFLMCISQEGKFLYISETVSSHLGLSQLDLIGSSVFNVVHPEDHQQFSELLCSSVTPNYDCMNLDDLDAMNVSEMMRRQEQGYISIFSRMKCALVKRGGCSVKSAGYKVIHISGQMVPFKDVDYNGERSVALVATGQPLPPPTMCQLKLDTKVFVSRVGMDLKISFCEGKIRKYMDFTARDIVGISAYEFYHLNDMTIVQDAHSQCIDGGKCISGVYRWMNKTGGWVRMQTVGTVIKRNTPKGEEQQILCVNYIWSEVESGEEVIHTIQQHFNQMKITHPESQKDTLDDFGTEVPGQISSDDVKASLVAATVEDESGSGATAFNKESYILALKYKAQVDAAAKAEVLPSQPLDKLLGPQGLAIPSINDHIPSWQESQAMDDANALATHMLLAELESENTPIKFPFEEAALNSPDSGMCEMSPIMPNLPVNFNTKQAQDVFMMKATSQNMMPMNAYDIPGNMMQQKIDLNMTSQRITCDVTSTTHEQQMISPPGYTHYQNQTSIPPNTSMPPNVYNKLLNQRTIYYTQTRNTNYDQNQNHSPAYNQFCSPSLNSAQNSTHPITSQAPLGFPIKAASNQAQMHPSQHHTNMMSPDHTMITDIDIKQEPMDSPYDNRHCMSQDTTHMTHVNQSNGHIPFINLSNDIPMKSDSLPDTNAAMHSGLNNHMNVMTNSNMNMNQFQPVQTNQNMPYYDHQPFGPEMVAFYNQQKRMFNQC